MTWSDFLKYSKFIAVFYALAFALAFSGIWINALGQKFILSGVLMAGTALASNVALGIYHANHKGAMLMAKNDHIIKTQGAGTVTGDGKVVQLTSDNCMSAELDDYMKDQVRKFVRNERGY